MHLLFIRPLLVAYFDVNYDHQFVKDTQFIRNKIVEVAKKYGTSNLKFAISNEVEFEDEIRSEIKFSYQSTVFLLQMKDSTVTNIVSIVCF